LWSDSDGSGSGYIYIYDRAKFDTRTNSDRTSSLISTASGGGSITLGGGSASTTLASGTVVPSSYAIETTSTAPGGVTFGYFASGGHNSGITFYSGGGNITVRGKSTSVWSSSSDGIAAIEGLTMDAGSTGNITLDGQGGSASASYSSGIYLDYWGSGATVGTLFKTKERQHHVHRLGYFSH